MGTILNLYQSGFGVYVWLFIFLVAFSTFGIFKKRSSTNDFENAMREVSNPEERKINNNNEAKPSNTRKFFTFLLLFILAFVCYTIFNNKPRRPHKISTTDLFQQKMNEADKVEISPKQTPFFRVKLTPVFRSKLTPVFRSKLTPLIL